MNILGISAYFHDSAAVMLSGGKIIAAAQEERFTRKKHDAEFPRHAIQYCLLQANISMCDVDYVVFYDKPHLKFDRLIRTYLAFAPKGFESFSLSVPLWLKQKAFLKKLLSNELNSLFSGKQWKDYLLFSEHHLSHAASAFFPSPFNEAAILTLDGVGEWATTSLATGRGNSIEIDREIHFPHSLGLLYSAFTYYTGFKVNSGEYKVMGLAPYGEPRFTQKIYDHIVDVKPDGSFRLDQRYFNYCAGLTMTSSLFDELFGGRPRLPGEPLLQRHMDLAASIQVVTEEIILKLTRSIAKETGLKNLCLAGGVALNCVANGKIVRDGKFEKVWIQPAAGDAGGALGAALAAHYLFFEQPRKANDTSDSMHGALLGPAYSQCEIEKRLLAIGARFEVLPDDELAARCANEIASGKAIGWFQGRMEFGPRALGARSILADPRSPEMQKTLNLKIKFRESFRPFAPAVLQEFAGEWFDLDVESPYMLLVADVKKSKRKQRNESECRLSGLSKLGVLRSEIPAVTHVDYSARVQTVNRETNPRFYGIISEFYRLTGCPVLINTSFNVRGEPIVSTPEDAFRCFMGTNIEVLGIGNCLLLKEQQDMSLMQNYISKFELD